jgi:hypothetical protein
MMESANPVSTLVQIAGGYCLPRCLHAVADLGVADALDSSPRTAAELAGAVGADLDALGRVLRLLSAHGVFELRGDGVHHTAASRLLRTDHPQSLRAFVRLFGLPFAWSIFGAMGHSLRTGHPAAEKALPEGVWTYCAEHADEATIFNMAMAAKAQAHIAEIITAYDFSGFCRIGDIGGGRGHLLRAVLAAVPTATGVLFDVPKVVEEAASLGSERLTFQAGDFFKGALPVCDAYLVMEVIHDWNDADSVAILKAIRRAAPPRAKLLLIEQIVPDNSGPHWSKMLDIHMLALLGGRQRTRPEYEDLFARAGFAFTREIATRADISILEAIPA